MKAAFFVLGALATAVGASAGPITDINQMPGSAFGNYGLVVTGTSNHLGLTSDTFINGNVAIDAGTSVSGGGIVINGELDNNNSTNGNLSGTSATSIYNLTNQTSGQGTRAGNAVADAASLFSLYTASTVLNNAVTLTSGTVNVSSNPGYNYNGESNEFVYKLTTTALANDTTLAIDATNSQYVIIDIVAGGNANFALGDVTLSGGITSDHVLLNFDSSSGGQLTTTSNYTINAIVDAGESDTNVGWDGATLNGRLFCVTTQNNCQVVSNATINSNVSTPEPMSMLLTGSGLLLLILVFRATEPHARRGTGHRTSVACLSRL